MKAAGFRKLFLFIVLLVFAACDDGSPAEPLVDATLTLTAFSYEYWDFNRTATYLLVHDKDGKLIGEKEIELSDEPREYTLEQVPLSGTITVATTSTYTIEYSNEDSTEYESLGALTLPVQATQEETPLATIYVSTQPFFEWFIDGIMDIKMKPINLTGNCPEDYYNYDWADQLASRINLYNIFFATLAYCDDWGRIYGSVRAFPQDDGTLSAVLWAERTDGNSFSFTSPMMYAAVWDVAEKDTINITYKDYHSEDNEKIVVSPKLIVKGAPEGSELDFAPYGMRKGAEVAGSFVGPYKHCDSENSSDLCISSDLVNTLDQFDGYLINAYIYKNINNNVYSKTIRWNTIKEYQSSTTWNYEDFYPFFTSAQLSYDPLIIQVEGGPETGYPVIEFYSHKLGKTRDKFLRWMILQLNRSDIVAAPELPSYLAAFKPAADDYYNSAYYNIFQDNLLKEINLLNSRFAYVVNYISNSSKSLNITKKYDVPGMRRGPLPPYTRRRPRIRP